MIDAFIFVFFSNIMHSQCFCKKYIKIKKKI